jgi:hypothetical protein
MKINIVKIDEENIAELISDNIEINKTQDVLDLMANCFVLKTKKLIIYEKILFQFFLI